MASSSRVFLLSGLALALAGCAGNPLQTATAVGERTSLAGELTTQSKVNANNGSRYQSFSLRLRSGEAVEVRESEAVSTQLTLFDSRGRLISGPGSDVLTLAPPQDGTYSLNVSGASAADYGPFRLALKRLEVRNSGDVFVGESFVGVLAGGGNEYRLRVEEAAIYSFSMGSEEFDTHLSLQGNELTLENDDGNDGTNSQIEAYLQPGDYVLRARALENDAQGASFTLAVNQRQLPAGVELQNSGLLREGQTVTGLVSMSPTSYSLELKQAALVHLDMRSSEVDSLLELSGGSLSVSDDDSGGNHDARISQLLQPGRYKVEARSMSGTAGLFELSYSQMPMRQASLPRIEPGQYARGQHSTASPGQARLVIREAGEYVVDLSSDDFDVMLEMAGEGVEREDDDSAGGTNARISQYLEAGEYQLKVSAVGGDGSGRFVLSVRSGE